MYIIYDDTVQVANVEVTGEEWEEELRESFTESGLYPGIYGRKSPSPGHIPEISDLAISELKYTFALTIRLHLQLLR